MLVNSNPATIMTDPEFADATYVEPITPEVVAKIIERERPDALLATLGGQTALNCAVALHEQGVLERVRRRADRRRLRRDPARRGPAGVQGDRRPALPAHLGAESARSVICHSMEDCLAGAAELGYPVVVRPVVHDGRRRLGDRVRRGRPAPHRRRRAAGQPHHRGAARGVDPGLEGVRARADARPRPTTSSSSARSRTSTRWACTPATRSPSRRR